MTLVLGIGDSLGAYRVTGMLCRWPRHILYHAIHEERRRFVLIRQFNPENLEELPEWTALPATMPRGRRFDRVVQIERERFELVQKIRLREPGAVSLVESFADDTFYAVLAHPALPELQQTIGELGPLEETQLSALIRPVANVLSALHRRDIIYGALGPEQIFVAPGAHPQAVLAGFDGVYHTRGLGAPKPWPDSRPGWAPEFFNRQAHPGIAADVYSLAVTIFLLAHGDAPQDSLEERAESLAQSGYSDRLRETVLAGLDHNPAKRPQSIDAFVELAFGTEDEREPQAPSAWRPAAAQLASRAHVELRSRMEDLGRKLVRTAPERAPVPPAGGAVAAPSLNFPQVPLNGISAGLTAMARRGLAWAALGLLLAQMAAPLLLFWLAALALRIARLPGMLVAATWAHLSFVVRGVGSLLTGLAGAVLGGLAQVDTSVRRVSSSAAAGIGRGALAVGSAVQFGLLRAALSLNARSRRLGEALPGGTRRAAVRSWGSAHRGAAAVSELADGTRVASTALAREAAQSGRVAGTAAGQLVVGSWRGAVSAVRSRALVAALYLWRAIDVLGRHLSRSLGAPISAAGHLLYALWSWMGSAVAATYRVVREISWPQRQVPARVALILMLALLIGSRLMAVSHRHSAAAPPMPHREAILAAKPASPVHVPPLVQSSPILEAVLPSKLAEERPQRGLDPEFRKRVAQLIASRHSARAALHPERMLKGPGPRYPVLALRRKIEGWIDIVYDVSPQGFVQNIRVSGATNPRVRSIFAGEVVRATSLAIYSPAMRNGQPVWVRDRTRRFVFRIAS